MVNEAKIKELLQQTKVFDKLAEEYEDENITDVSHGIYDQILNELGVENDFNNREAYYDIFAEFHFGLVDEDTVINRIKLVK